MYAVYVMLKTHYNRIMITQFYPGAGKKLHTTYISDAPHSYYRDY